MAGLVAVRSQQVGKGYRQEAILPLHHVLAAGPVSRGEVRIGLPLDALSILLPNLYPEAATQPLD